MGTTVTGLLNVVAGPIGLRLAAYFLLTLPTATIKLEYHPDATPEGRQRVERMRQLTVGWSRSFGWLFFWLMGIYGTTLGVMQLAGVAD